MKLLLFVKNMIKYLEHPGESTENLSLSEFSEVIEHKIICRDGKSPYTRMPKSVPINILACVLSWTHMSLSPGRVLGSRTAAHGTQGSCFDGSCQMVGQDSCSGRTTPGILASVCRGPRECASGARKRKTWAVGVQGSSPGERGRTSQSVGQGEVGAEDAGLREG